MHARCVPWSRPALAAALLFCGVFTPASAKITALVGGRLIDGWGGAPVNNSIILIDGERIKAVGTAETITVPAGADVIDTRGMSILPGLWDCHVHTMLLGHSDYDHWDKTYPARFEKEIMPAAAHQLLNAGITSAIDLGAPLGRASTSANASTRERFPARRSMFPAPSSSMRPIPAPSFFAGA
jgi:imidazolonepropionase-like amidohydrolase